MELNPNHPTTQRVSDQWHKLCAIVIHMAGERAIEITPDDIQAFTRDLGEGASIVADARDGRFVLRLVDGKEAARLARQEGGLPL